MAMDPLFNYTDYKKYLNDQIDQNEHVRGYKSLLADAAGCQRSFMSQVLNGPVHITPDHAVGLAGFFKFGPDATEFYIELVHYGRAATPALRGHLAKRLKAIQTKMKEESVRINNPELEEIEHQAIYYSHWYWTAVHMLAGMKNYNTEKQIADRLHLPPEMIKQALNQLANMGLVAKDKGAWKSTGKNIHAPAESLYSWLHHDSWRAKAGENFRKRPPGAVHFTGVYTLSKADMEKVGDLTLDLMDNIQKIVGPSPEEDAACLCLDWFGV